MGGALSMLCHYLRRLGGAAKLQDAPKPALEQPAASDGAPPAPTAAEQRAFLDAAKWFNFAKVFELVLSKPSLVNCQLPGRWTALHHAAQHGDDRVVQFLLERGASTTALTIEGWTPLEVAHPRVFDLLLAATISAVEEREAAKEAVPRTSEKALAGLLVRKFSELSPTVAGDAVCQICLEEVGEEDKVRSLPCGHFFHTGCVDVWLKEKSSSCPTCRREIA